MYITKQVIRDHIELVIADIENSDEDTKELLDRAYETLILISKNWDDVIATTVIQ